MTEPYESDNPQFDHLINNLNDDSVPYKTASLADVKARLKQRLVEDGVEFGKCANCGDEYPRPEMLSDTICSKLCADAYVAYLNDPIEWS